MSAENFYSYVEEHEETFLEEGGGHLGDFRENYPVTEQFEPFLKSTSVKDFYDYVGEHEEIFLEEEGGDSEDFLKEKGVDSRDFLKEKGVDSGEFLREKGGDLEEFLKEKGWESGEYCPATSWYDVQDALWALHPTVIVYDDDGVDKFFDIARALKIKAIAKMREMLRSDEINLKFYGIDPRIVQAISEALELNTYVKRLDLEGNLLDLDACYYLNEMLRQNSTISSVNLSGCKIGPEGVQLFHNSLVRSPVLEEFDLTDCELGDEGMFHLSNAVQENGTLLTLILKNNQLTESCAEDICSMLNYNYTLQKLDLSWNELCTENALGWIFKGLTENQCVKYLDLSWNGIGKIFSDQALLQICNFLSSDPGIETLKLKYNGFTESDAEKIGQSLMRNSKLKNLYLGGNPITQNGAVKLILMIENTPNSGIEMLELSQVWVNKCRPSSINIENNKITKADFQDVINHSQKHFSTALLVIEILKTVPRNDKIVEDIKKSKQPVPKKDKDKKKQPKSKKSKKSKRKKKK